MALTGAAVAVVLSHAATVAPLPRPTEEDEEEIKKIWAHFPISLGENLG